METNLQEISHTLKDTFDFVKRTEKDLEMGAALRVAYIKRLYTNIHKWQMNFLKLSLFIFIKEWSIIMHLRLHETD